LVVAALLALSVQARTEPGVSIELCVSGKGMASQVLNRSSKHIIGTLKSLKVEFVKPPVQGNCCTQPACLGEEAVQLGAHGILVVEMLRFGPMVQASFFLFDAVTKKQLLAIKANASARKFPAADTFAADLSRCIQVLRKHTAAHPLIAAPRRKPPPTTKPKPVSPPPPRKPKVISQPSPPASPSPVTGVEEGAPSDSGWYWLGGSLLAGGISLVAAGLYLLLDPMQAAEDEVNQKTQLWRQETDQEKIAELWDDIRQADEDAQDYKLAGWVGIGIGGALLAGGALALILGPESPKTRSARASLRPLVLVNGGGLVIECPW